MDFSITIENQDLVETKLNAVGESLTDMSAEFDQVGAQMEAYYSQDVFFSEGGVWSDPWPPLAESTIRQKSRNLGSMLAGASARTPLIRSGAMQAAFAHDASNTSVRVYNEVDYFQYHQLGTTTIPQRLMISMNDTLASQIKDIITASLITKIQG